jgi:hypothetical protein
MDSELLKGRVLSDCLTLMDSPEDLREAINETAAALAEHGLDRRETVNLAEALSMFHARGVAELGLGEPTLVAKLG